MRENVSVGAEEKMSGKYVLPLVTISSNPDEAKKFHASGSTANYRTDDPKLSIGDIARGNRNFIVGEPGIGKSSLLRQIDAHLKDTGYETCLVNLKNPKLDHTISDFIDRAGSKKALLLDALDEVQAKNFPFVLPKLESISATYPNLPIYISSRWIFASKHLSSFPEYRFISVSPFSRNDVTEFLKDKGHSQRTIETLFERLRPHGYQVNILQVPRYLTYMSRYLEKSGDLVDQSLTRNSLFEYFINSSLDEEAAKGSNDDGELKKRILEKLALVMEIYQTNVITRDDLMTFFDEISSDLKTVVLANVRDFRERSILKPGEDIEFENTEFQEYLAAKEISRLPDPGRAAFAFSVDPQVQEIYPSWFNALSFLAEFRTDLIEQFMEFAGLRAPTFKVVDEGLMNFLSKVNPALLTLELKRRIFRDVLAYHVRIKLWVPWNLAFSMAGFYDPLLETDLKTVVLKAESLPGPDRYIPLGIAVELLGTILDVGITIDSDFWRGRLIRYASEHRDNSVLQRNALHALSNFGDQTVIGDLPNLLGSDQLVTRAFINLCRDLAPNDEKSIEYFIEATRRNEIEARYGLFKVTEVKAIKRLLIAYIEDAPFRNEFMEKASIFSHEEDLAIVRNIENVFSDEIAALVLDAIYASLDYSLHHGSDNFDFVNGLWRLLRKHDPQFFRKLIGKLSSRKKDLPGLFFFSEDHFALTLEACDIPAFLDAMIAAGEEISAFNVMAKIRHGREAGEKLYQLGREKIPGQYAQRDAIVREKKTTIETHLEQFRKMLEPEPGHYMHGVFDYFNRHFKELSSNISATERQKLTTLVTDTVFKNIDPRKTTFKIKEKNAGQTQYTLSSNIPLFTHAVKTAKLLGLDLAPYRRKIIDLIPFSYGDDLKLIFDVVKTIDVKELDWVLGIYQDTGSDLRLHQPLSLVDAAERYRIPEAAPILRAMVQDTKYEKYVRRNALTALDSLAPNAVFLKQVFRDNIDQSGDARELALVANSLLITPHGDDDAIRWRLGEVRRNFFPHEEIEGAHDVGAQEHELWDKAFAKPLITNKRSGFEKDYLDLLEVALEIWGKGLKYHSYAQYLWDIAYSYFDNLKQERRYEPLQMLESKVSKIQSAEGANWLAAKMAELRRSYLAYLGRPRNISDAIKQYNSARAYDDKKILNAHDLFVQTKAALDRDLRRWIDGEGAYELIQGEKVFDRSHQQYEDLVQKTLKAQIENILLRRGYQVDLYREPQLLDAKRVDILLHYGFAGPIVIEIKMSSNSDLKGNKVGVSESYTSMRRYMDGYGAPHGIFLVVDNCKSTNIALVTKTFENIPNVSVQTFYCAPVGASKPGLKSTPPPANRAKKAASKRPRRPQKSAAKRLAPRK